MPSVGERLRRERENRNMTVEGMAAATGIGRSYLEALERDEIPTLPGPAFGKLYIRAYAEVLGFDPQPWIDDYDRAQHLAQGASAEPAPPEPSRPRPVAEAIARWKAERLAPDEVVKPTEAEPTALAEEAGAEVPVEAVVEAAFAPRREPAPTIRRRAAPLLIAGAIAIVAAIYIGTRGPSDGPPRVRPVPESRLPNPTPPVVETPETSPPQKPPPQTPPAKRAPVVRPAAEPGALTVSEFGVGRRIVNLRLEDGGDRFDQGARVCFATRVLGGRRGDVVRHVWLYDGRVEQSIGLTLGGPDWRTHSNKALNRAGPWAVEARDDNGGVLARATFACVAAGR